MNIDDKGRELLGHIVNWQKHKGGKSPTYKELAEMMHISPAAIWQRVKKLQAAGALKKCKQGWRSLTITHPEFALMSWDQMRDEIKRLTAERDNLARRLAQALKRNKTTKKKARK